MWFFQTTTEEEPIPRDYFWRFSHRESDGAGERLPAGFDLDLSESDIEAGSVRCRVGFKEGSRKDFLLSFLDQVCEKGGRWWFEPEWGLINDQDPDHQDEGRGKERDRLPGCHRSPE